jgi:hypothetical protein
MFWTYCSYACRAIILLSVIFLVGYVLLENNKSVEKFDDNTTQEQLDKYEVIRSVFQSYLFREPTNDEYKQYSLVMRNAGDISNLIAAMKSSPEFQNRVIENQNVMLDGIENAKYTSALKSVDPNIKLKVQKQVIDIYNKVLDRMPDSKELTFYTFKLINDKTFNTELLDKLLEGSQEYQRMTRNQSNLVNASLSANITTRQLHLEVKRIYESIVTDTPLSQEFETFLVSKYLEYNLDETRLAQLIRLMQTVDAGREVCPSIVINKPSGSVGIGSDASSANTYISTPSQSTVSALTGSSTTTSLPGTSNSSTGTTNPESQPKVVVSQEAPTQSDSANGKTGVAPVAKKEKVLNPSSHCSLEDPYIKEADDYMDPFTKAMLTNRCIFFQDKDTQNAQNVYRSQNALAESIMQRNADMCSVSGYDTYNSYTSIEDARTKTFVGAYVSPFGKR